MDIGVNDNNACFVTPAALTNMSNEKIRQIRTLIITVLVYQSWKEFSMITCQTIESFIGLTVGSNWTCQDWLTYGVFFISIATVVVNSENYFLQKQHDVRNTKSIFLLKSLKLHHKKKQQKTADGNLVWFTLLFSKRIFVSSISE